MTAPAPTGRDAAVKIVRVLHDAGHVAYFAGGCVRDGLLGLDPQDYDVATDARPDRVRELFHNSRYVGEAFGVVLVRLLGHEIEVATFRTEWGYEDGRRPTHVEFTDAEHDARRRDFTVNGLFENPLSTNDDPRVIDFVGGRDDLRQRIIRAIGDADERFGEDYLRMLRAARFAARLGFTIDERTARAIRFHAKQLGQISRERIGQEVQLMLTHPARALSMRLMQELQLDGPALNEDHLHAGFTAITALDPQASFPAVLAAWMLDRHFLHDAGAEKSAAGIEAFAERGAPAILRRWRRALCLSNEQCDALRALFQLLPRALAWPASSVAARKRLLASSCWSDAWMTLRAVAHEINAAELIHRIDVESQPLLSEGVAPAPLVTGDDLVALGMKPGPAFKKMLDAVYDEQLEGRLADKPAALVWLRSQG